MVVKILLIGMLIIAILMYLVIVGANKCKTAEERKNDEDEEIKAIEKWRQDNERKNKKKRHIFSRFW